MKRRKPLILFSSIGIAYNTSTTDALYKEGETSGDESRASSHDRGIASNADPVSTDEWIRIAKYGEWRDGSPQRVLQVLARENAEVMARNFNSLSGRLGRGFRGAPIFVGHPDCDPEMYPDHRRIGKIVALEARADGLWAKPNWNSLGEENLREGFHVYPSSVWRFPKPKPGEAKVYPDMFQSLGLTNFPAGDVDPVTFNAAVPDADDADDTNPQNEEDMKKLYELLGLDEASGEDGLIAAIMALQEQAATNAEMETEEVATEETTEETTEEADPADEAERERLRMELEEEKAKRETAENALVELHAAEATRLIGEAIASGAITAAEQPGWVERFATDHTAARNALASVKPGVALNTRSLEIGKGKVSVATSQERMIAVNAAVAALQAEKGLAYDVAFNQVKNSDEFKPVFAAMAEPVTTED